MSTNNWEAFGSGALKYGSTGAAAGSVFGPVGTAIGGVAGGLLGGFGSLLSNKSEREALKDYQKQLEEQYNQGVSTLGQYQKDISIAQKGYKDALDSADFAEAGKIDFDKDSYNLDDYRKSNENSIIEATKNKMKGENTGLGSSWGSGATGNILDAVVNQQEKLDEYADTQMNKERDFDYKVASDEATNNLNALKSQLEALGKSAELDTTNLTNYYNGILGLQNTANANQNALTSANLTANQQNAQNTASTVSNSLASLASIVSKNGNSGILATNNTQS